MTQRIAIIGGGNIGSRHLQAFGLSKDPLEIFLIDPAQASLDICAARWKEADQTNGKVRVIYSTDLNSLKGSFDMVIVATGSAHRLEVLKNLVETVSCKTILFEKYLFVEEEEYKTASDILSKHNIKAYVNVVRRTFEAFTWLKDQLAAVKAPLTMTVEGSNWGLASNAIHFIDLFFFLAGGTAKDCAFTGITGTEILPSKREGYIELLADLNVSSSNGSNLGITCGPGAYDKITMNIKKGSLKVVVEEIGSDIFITVGEESARKFPYPFQSQLTLRYFEEVKAGKPSMVSYDESAAMHLTFLKAVQRLLQMKNYNRAWKIT